MTPTARPPSKHPTLKLWIGAVHFAADAVLVAFVYFILRDFLKDGAWKITLYLFNKALANAALLLVGLSMLLSSLSRLRRIGADKLVYRKYLGVVGFGLAVLHVLMSHRALSAKFPWPDWLGQNWETALLGVCAFILFAVMTAVSNRRAVQRMGGARWRRFLSYAGYLGVLLVVVHASLLKGPSWLNWVRTFDPWLPSLSLPTTVFGLAVLAARLIAPRPDR
jgi:DMSO/TMAO reductase YedYZ heme-binding membrane subunit